MSTGGWSCRRCRRRSSGSGRATRKGRTSMRSGLSVMALVLTITATAAAQPGVLTRELLIEYTPEWKGERYPDGRPKVPDAILDRMKTVTLEEAWAVVTGAGFSHQFDDRWLSIHPDKVLVGRALTSQWLPGRRSEERRVGKECRARWSPEQ